MHYFTILSPQPISIRYTFHPLVLLDCQHGEPECGGTVLIWITVSHKESGPFETGICTTTSIWEGRKMARVGPKSKARSKELDAYREHRVLFNWDKLMRQDEQVTGEMIMEEITRHDSLRPHESI